LCVTETSLCIVTDAPTGMLHKMITFRYVVTLKTYDVR